MAEKTERTSNPVDKEWNIPDGEFCVYGTVYAHPDHADQVETLYKETTRRAQHEEGIVYYCLSRDGEDPTIFHFFERYMSKEAFKRHNDQHIIREFVASGWMRDVRAVFVKPITP